MGTLPTLTLLLDDGTGTFPTNISSRARAFDGWEMTRGRADWQGAVTAGELRLTLDNSDGFFTVGAGAVFVDQKMRISETIAGVTYTRFTGYVKSWPTSWPAVVVTFSTVQPTATDAQARAERTTLRSMLEEEILADSPTAYYTLGEASGATAAGDTSGNQAAALAVTNTGTTANAAMSFGSGTGPGADGLSAAVFAKGQFLSATAKGSAGTFLGGGSTWTLEAFVVVPTAPSAVTSMVAVNYRNPGDSGWDTALLGVNTDGTAVLSTNVFVAAGLGGNANSVTNIADGHTHHIVGTLSGGTLTIWVDGVAEGTFGSSSPPAAMSYLYVGGGITQWANLTGTVSHVAVYDGTALSSTRIAAHAAIGLNTTTEAGTARLTRLAGYAGIPVGTLDTSLTTVGAQAISGSSAFSAMQDVADAEGGPIFIDGSGNLTFHNRARVSVKTAPDLTLDRQWVTPEVQPVLDDQNLVNYFETTATGTGSTQFAFDVASETLHGRYPESKTYLVLTDQEALDRANWALAKLATPVPRYGTLTINLFGMTAAQASTVLSALEINCWLRVTSLASQTIGGTTADVVVEGWQEQVTAESWSITCNVVDHSLFVAGIYNSATLGVYNTSVYSY